MQALIWKNHRTHRPMLSSPTLQFYKWETGLQMNTVVELSLVSSFQVLNSIISNTPPTLGCTIPF